MLKFTQGKWVKSLTRLMYKGGENMDNIILQQLIVPVVSSLILAGLAYLVTYATGLTAQIKDARIRYHIEQAINIVEQTVESINQRVVDDLKEADEFTPAKQREVFHGALELAKKKMSEDTIKAITEAHNDFQLWLEDETDKQVKLAKERKQKTVKEYLESKSE